MSILSKIFNKFSYPKTISIPKANIDGRFVGRVCGSSVTEWQYSNYTVSIYAKRNFDNTYDINLKKHSDYLDSGKIKLHENISIHKAIRLLKKYDDSINNYENNYKRGRKTRKHYEKTRVRLIKNGIIKH